MHYSYAFSALTFFASTASASLVINNWCSQDIYIFKSRNGGCDAGTNGACSNAPNASPWHLPPANGYCSILTLPWEKDGLATSVKISKEPNWRTVQPGILQFEYTWATGLYANLYWDLSDLDGLGNGKVGSPFIKSNVRVTPTGPGSGSGTCVKLKCPAGSLCREAYNTPEQVATRACPLSIENVYVDLCEPTPRFNGKREIGFEA